MTYFIFNNTYDEIEFYKHIFSNQYSKFNKKVIKNAWISNWTGERLSD